VIHYSRKY